jgi:hypothetical protein
VGERERERRTAAELVTPALELSDWPVIFSLMLLIASILFECNKLYVKDEKVGGKCQTLYLSLCLVE